jgi:demethylmenaquinone methyltransferase/2-methoxy-6-polyprenyl-1,4-benzoquinol methylase
MTLDKRPETIQTMFNMISEKYDFMNNVISFGFQNFVKTDSIKMLNIKPHENILDLCCGTGDLTKIIKNYYPTAFVTGVDFSDKMIEIAKNKVLNAKFIQADATNLPFPDNTFDAVTMGFGLRNIQNAEKAIEEIYRVLRPNGRFLHLDFGEKNFLSKIYDKTILSIIGLFTDNTFAYKYLINSKKTFLTPNDLIKDFEKKGFELIMRKDYIFKVISCQILKK